jgi:hypothetical protein
MGPYRDRLRVVAAVLLVAATVLLVVGTSLERSQASPRRDRLVESSARPANTTRPPSRLTSTAATRPPNKPRANTTNPPSRPAVTTRLPNPGRSYLASTWRGLA